MSERTARWLGRAPASLFTAYALFSAFGAYFCMYGFRKAFAAASYAGQLDLGPLGRIDTKVALIVAQIVGYCLSKFIGIRVIAEMTRARRALTLAAAITAAEVTLIAFALVPPSLAPICLFLNGLPLGLTWGLVFGSLEGRRTSDLLGAGLCASFIVASGFAKSVGLSVLGYGVSEAWMPAATGALFLLPMFLFVWMLAQLPPPSAEDEAHRMKREPMSAADRRGLLARAAPGLVSLVLAYVLLTTYRDFRDNFALELWGALGFSNTPALLTTTELPVAFGAITAVGLVMMVRDSQRAVAVVHALMAFGGVLIGASTLLFRGGFIGPVPWMILAGVGLYIGYVPFNCVLFDRLLPALGVRGNAGFLIYVADSFGYLGSVALLFYKNFSGARLSWVEFFGRFGLAVAASSIGLFVVSGVYFARGVTGSERRERAAQACVTSPGRKR